MISSYLIDTVLDFFKNTMSKRSDKEKLIAGITATVVLFILLLILKSYFTEAPVTIGDLDAGKSRIDRNITDVKDAVNSVTPPKKSTTDRIGVEEAIQNQDSDSDAM